MESSWATQHIPNYCFGVVEMFLGRAEIVLTNALYFRQTFPVV